MALMRNFLNWRRQTITSAFNIAALLTKGISIRELSIASTNMMLLQLPKQSCSTIILDSIHNTSNTIGDIQLEVKACVAVAVTNSGYDVTFKTSGNNYAIAHCDEQWVIQSVSRMASTDSFKFSQYAVIPQPVRIAVKNVVNNQTIIDALITNGQWTGELSFD